MTTSEGMLTPERARKMIEALEARAEWVQLKIVAKTLTGKKMEASYEAAELRALRWVLTLAETEWDYLVRADERYDIKGRVPLPPPILTPQQRRAREREKAARKKAKTQGSLDLCTAEG